MAILKIIGILLEVVLLFNLLIVVHELGHFLAAKWRGAVIEGFGIWFGKPIWQKKIGGVTYSLGSIPAGGFVKLPQLMESAIEGDSEYAGKDMPRLKPWDKIIIAFAGPLFSFGLACVFAVLVWQVGRPVSEGERTTTIGSVIPGAPAEAAGLKPGDEIVKIDGIPVNRWGGQSKGSIQWRVAGGEEQTVKLEVLRGKEVLNFEIKPEVEKSKWYTRRPLRSIGIEGKQRPMVAKVEPGSAAEKAGFKPNDVLTKVGGEPIYDDSTIEFWVKAHPGEPIPITVERPVEPNSEIVKEVELSFVPRGVVVGAVEPDSPAARGGLLVNDRVLALDDHPVSYDGGFLRYVQAHDGKPVKVSIERGGEQKMLTVIPGVPSEGGGENPKASIGVLLERGDGLAFDRRGKLTPSKMSPLEQISEATGMILETLKKISPTSKSAIGLQQMGGPVMMMRIYYLLFESPQGWKLVLWFSVVINVNLALMNMLPIPPLDGSHITLALIELIRGRPPGEHTQKVVEYVQAGGTILVIGFMLYVTMYDVQDLFNGGGNKKPPTRRWPPAPANVGSLGSPQPAIAYFAGDFGTAREQARAA
jgi:regulator of sigma E protease